MEPPFDLREIVLKIIETQNGIAAMMNAMQADLETLRLTLILLDPRVEPILQKALAANRERYAQELASKQAELQLIRAKVSKVVM
jgi:hypothetical protein